MPTAPLFAAAPASPAVLLAARSQIARRGIDGHRGYCVVDPAGHLVGVAGLHPLARVRPVQDRPDLVARLADGSLAAVVASSNPDLDDCLDRAAAQRTVAHYVSLALGAAPSARLKARAEQDGVGILVTGDPVPAVPARRRSAAGSDALHRALNAVAHATVAHQFHYNVPTNFLVWLLGVDANNATAVADVRGRIAEYPVTAGSAGLKGAELLGLLRNTRGHVSLTPHGRAVRAVMPSLRSWTQVHQSVKGSGSRLADEAPEVAAAVRRALVDLPAAAFVSEALADLGGSASLRDLVSQSVRRDPVFGPALFLKPEGTAALTRPDGSIAAHDANGAHVADRPTFQFKSLLQHVGVLASGPIRSRTDGVLDLDRTVWALAPEFSFSLTADASRCWSDSRAPQE